jgi:hypothetical protein
LSIAQRHAIEATDVRAVTPKDVVRVLRGEMMRRCDEPGVCFGVIGSASEPEEGAVHQDDGKEERLVFEDFFFMEVRDMNEDTWFGFSKTAHAKDFLG